jgi:hypothetical protein
VKAFAYFCCLWGLLALTLTTPARAQTTAAERFKALTDPEGVEKALDKAKEKLRPPYEFFRSQVAPFDVLPFVKVAHWSTLSLELRANLGPYDGQLRSAPVKLFDMPHAVAYRRDAQLIQDQTRRLSLQLMFPQYFKEYSAGGFGIDLSRPDAIRPDAIWSAPILQLQSHQMLIQILSQDPNQYANWNKLHAVIPSSGDKDPNSLDKQRYYRIVQPQAPEKPVLSPHPLTWTTMSHLIWDDYSPEILSSGHQQAMIDWLQWGGQMVIVSSVGASLAPLQESFLGPYLPAVPSGKNTPLQAADLEQLSQAYRPPMWPGDFQEALETQAGSHQGLDPRKPPRYQSPAPIKTPLNRPVLLTGLTPVEGATPIYLNGPESPMIAVEKRVGRGRVTIVAFRLTDPAIASWEGFDTLVRRLVLRRPEETWTELERRQKLYGFLGGPKLTWFRLLGRDLDAVAPPAPADQQPLVGELPLPTDPVAAWLDTSPNGLPVTTRKALEVASGITIPPHRFVAQVMVAYIVALVPLNWLVCRYLLRRRELAWAVVPVLALGFALGVERLAAHDLGYDSAADEIDVVELQGGYGRAHINRFVALYSTGRVQANISFPNDPSALALPMNMQRSLPGEEVVHSVFQSSPEPALIGFPVQPRSLAMYRAEQLLPVLGPIELVNEGKSRRVVNRSDLELRDAVLVNTKTDERIALGNIAPAASATVPESGATTAAGIPTKKVDWIDLEPFLEKLRAYRWKGPEDEGEMRLVAWTPDAHPGQRIDPKVDRHRGFRLVVAHLRYDAPPDCSQPPYFSPPTREEESNLETYDVIKNNRNRPNTPGA